MTTRRCSKCKEMRPVDAFQHRNGRPSGQCRICKTEAMKAHRRGAGIAVRPQSRIENGMKLCMTCREMKPCENFSATERGRGGLSANCKPCHADRYRNKEKARRATARYRKVNRERHLAAHRVRMFEYNQNKKVGSDGTVTDQFLVTLYGTENCFYCGRATPGKARTADHKTSLKRGGAHSSSNLVMACWDCNSSKRHLSAEEFLAKVKHDHD